MYQFKKGISTLNIAAIIIIAAFLVSILACSSTKSVKTENPYVQKLLTEIKTYDYGQDRESISLLDDQVRLAQESPEMAGPLEKEMAAFLKSDATFAAKQHVCEQLSVIGTRESVPAIAELLKNKKEADIALFALQRITDPSANTALLNALPNSGNEVKTAIINSLGERRDPASVSELEKLLYDKSSGISFSAAAALGKIADNTSLKALHSARAKTTGTLRVRILDACLRCTDDMLAKDNKSGASDIYQDIYRNEKENFIRSAALRGYLQANTGNAVNLIHDVLKNDNEELHFTAINFIRELPEKTDLSKIITLLPGVPAPGKVQLLSVFSDRRETVARQAVLKAASHNNEDVRIAAVKTLANVGNESDLSFLVNLAAGTKGLEQEAARESLYHLRGESIDRTIISQITSAEPEIKAEFARSLGQRSVFGSVETLLNTAVDPDRNVRRESLRSLAILAPPDYINNIIQILINENNITIRKEAEKSLVTISKKLPDSENKVKLILDVLPTVSNSETKGSLIQALGKIGDKNALPVLFENLKSTDDFYQESAIHALTAWNDTEPVKPLMDIVKTTSNETNKILSLRAYITLLNLRNKRTDKESISLYLAAMEHASEINEKRMVLSGFGNLRSMEAIETAAKYLDEESIQPEAEAAVFRLSGRIEDADKNRVKELLGKVRDITKNQEFKQRVTNRINSIK